jgi:hypothetical protein
MYLVLNSYARQRAFQLEVRKCRMRWRDDCTRKDAIFAVDYSKLLPQFLESGFLGQYIDWLWVWLHGLISWGDGDFSRRFSVEKRFWGLVSSYYLGLSLRGKAVGAWSWPLIFTSTEAKNAWNYTFTPSHIFLACCLIRTGTSCFVVFFFLDAPTLGSLLLLRSLGLSFLSFLI